MPFAATVQNLSKTESAENFDWESKQKTESDNTMSVDKNEDAKTENDDGQNFGSRSSVRPHIVNADESLKLEDKEFDEVTVSSETWKDLAVEEVKGSMVSLRSNPDRFGIPKIRKGDIVQGPSSGSQFSLKAGSGVGANFGLKQMGSRETIRSQHDTVSHTKTKPNKNEMAEFGSQTSLRSGKIVRKTGLGSVVSLGSKNAETEAREHGSQTSLRSEIMEYRDKGILLLPWQYLSLCLTEPLLLQTVFCRKI